VLLGLDNLTIDKSKATILVWSRKETIMKKIQLAILIFILFGASLVRLYKFNNPLTDWHSWRQTDTAAVSRSFVNSGFDVLHPRFEDISNVPSGKDNPEGYRFVEFPIYNVLHASLYKLFNYFTLVQWGRLVTIVLSLTTCLLIYKLVKKYADPISGLFAAAFYAFIPFSIYYGRVILPDPAMVTFSLAGIYFFDIWLDREIVKRPVNWLWFTLSLLCTATAFLIKPYALFYTLPLMHLVFYKLGFSFYKKWPLYLYLILSVIPLIFWRVWITQYPEGIPVSDWLFNGGNIRFKGSFFYWIFAERIGKLICGYFGISLFASGILYVARKKHILKNFFFVSFLASSLLYLTVIARGNVQHDYYQILIVPTIAMFMGLGSGFLLNLPREYYHQSVGFALLTISAIFSLNFGWYYVRDFYNYNPQIVVAGNAADKILPKNSRVIAIVHGSEGDTTFLYHTNRQGWASFQNDLPIMIKKGARYLIFASPTREDLVFAKTYKTVASTSDYIIFDLR